MAQQFEYPTRVTYGEVDQQLRLTLRGAMAMMQEAAIVHSSQAGYAVEDIPRTHVIWMLVRWRVKRIGAVRWNEAVTVETWPRSMARVTSVRNWAQKPPIIPARVSPIPPTAWAAEPIGKRQLPVEA